MAHTGLTSELRELARESAQAADHATEDALTASYEALRRRALTLNRRNCWVSEDELATLFPRLDEIMVMESLDLAFGETAGPVLPADRGRAARLAGYLRQLSGWATGMRLAYETLGSGDGE